MKSDRTLILGIGNLLMGDEGVGVHAVQALEHASLPPSVHVLDGGTGGFHLLSYFKEYPSIIMIDATTDGKPAGTLNVLRPRFASDFPRTLTAHDIGLRDLVETAMLVNHTPDITLITVSIDSIQPMQTTLSPAVRDSIPEIGNVVRSLIDNPPKDVNS